MGASVRARLRNVMKETGQEFDWLLAQYANERLLYRLSRSEHADRFVLKGAALLTSWFDEPIRMTHDLDFLGYGDLTAEMLLGIFRELFDSEEPDGVVFDSGAARILPIRVNDFGGFRIRTVAKIEQARVQVTVDVGFGTPPVPAARMYDFPALIGMPAARMHGIVRETVVAEKLHAMAEHGEENARLKDYYDIWILSRSFKFDFERLGRAIAATFGVRGTPLPDGVMKAMSPEFSGSALKQRHWEMFKRKVVMDPGTLPDVIDEIQPFVLSAIAAAREVLPDRTQ